MTVAMGDAGEMEKAIEMLGSVKDSIIKRIRDQNWSVPAQRFPTS